MLHIKPSADRADFFQFKANFIRFLRRVKTGMEGETIGALTNEIENESGGGFSETCSELALGIKAITGKHTLACRIEILSYLEAAAKELKIEV